MSRARAYAWLRHESPYHDIFREGLVPIKGVIPAAVNLIGDAETSAYFLDWKACSYEQRFCLSILLASRQGGLPAEVMEYASRGGEIPVRVSQVRMVTCDIRIFL